MKELLASLYEYGVSTNERLLTLAEKLTDEQLHRQFSQGSRSIRDNFVHLLRADLGWLAGFKNEPPTAMPTPEEVPTVEAIRARWALLILERRGFITGLPNDKLEQTILGRDGKPSTLRLWQAMLQCANHGTQHRSELAAMLTDCDHSPGDLDLLDFCFEHKPPQDASTQEPLTLLYEYAIWANQRLLDKAANLSDAQLRQTFSKGYGSILDTFAHLVSAERRWLSRWREAMPPAVLTSSDLPTVDAIRQTWAALCAARRAYIAALDETTLQASARFALAAQPPRELIRWQAMLHVANHGMQHRSEIAAMLTDLGQPAGDMDFLYFVLNRQQ